MATLLLAAPVYAQSTLPATAPTSLPAANSLPAPIAATPSGRPATRPQRAEVTYSNGLLDVRANDSSLNQILRTIAQLTGMKITGGVAESRVFGNYGPAEPTTVLATLLDGTGSNMLLRETAADQPAELVLTPRTGGPTPPNPYASSADDEDRQAPAPRPASYGPPPQAAYPPRAQQQPRSGPPPQSAQPWNNVNGSASNTTPTASTLPVTNSVSADSLPTPSTAASTSGIVDSPNPPPAGSGLPAPTNSNDASGSNASSAAGSSGTTNSNTSGSTSDGSAKTPEQIYQQLRNLLNQSQKQNQSGQTQTNQNQTAPASTQPQ